MNSKKIISLLFVMLLGASSFAFAANNDRTVYSVYSDNFIGAHIYGSEVNIPTSDTDGIKFYPWKADWADNKLIMSAETIDSTVEDPAPEGKKYMRYLWGFGTFSTTYVGCSYTRVTGMDTTTSINMSAYAGGKIKFSARSDKNYAKKCKVGFQHANGSQNWFTTPLENVNENWQEFSYDIPSGVSNVNVLFMVMIDGEPEHTVGENFLDIDNIRWVKPSGAASISVVRKKVSDNTTVSDQLAPISFSEDTFGQGWSVADQYLEMDVDGDLVGNNWTVRINSSATEQEKAGLYNSTINDNLPMAWKVSCSTLPYSYTDKDGPNIDTLQIGEHITTGEPEGLYDAGKVALRGEGAKWWYPWLYIMKKGDNSDFSLILNNKGYHTYENSGMPTFNVFTDGIYIDTYERKARLFLACDTKNAKSVEYTASLILTLAYE